MIVLYGQQYASSSIYFKIKTISNIFNLIIFAPLLINTGKVKFYSNVHAFTAISVITLEYISILLVHSPYAVAIVSLLCQLGKIFILLTAVAHMFHVTILQLFPIRIIKLILLPSLLILYMLYYSMGKLQLSSLATLSLSLILYVVLFGLFAHYKKLNYISIIRPLILKKDKGNSPRHI